MTDRIDFGGEPWQAIPRRVLRDAHLSPRAKGGLVTLLSHEEGWVRSAIATLMRECDCGREQAQKIMRELVSAGYADLRKVRGAGGRFTSTYLVRAWPSSSRVQASRSPSTGFPSTVTPPVEVEPLDVDPLQLLAAPSRGDVENIGKPRQRNSLFDALAELHGGSNGVTPSLGGRIGKALKEIRSVMPDVSPEEISRRAHNYQRLSWNREHNPPTATALAANWPDCDMPPAVAPLPSSDGYITDWTDAELEEALRDVRR